MEHFISILSIVLSTLSSLGLLGVWLSKSKKLQANSDAIDKTNEMVTQTQERFSKNSDLIMKLQNEKITLNEALLEIKADNKRKDKTITCLTQKIEELKNEIRDLKELIEKMATKEI